MTEGEPALVEVEVFDAEVISGRGTLRTSWFVRRQSGWVKAADWEGATSERRDAGPGTVWERAVRVRVPVGAELMKVEVRPRPAERQDPFSHLRHGTKPALKATRRTHYRVTAGGRLAAAAKPR